MSRVSQDYLDGYVRGIIKGRAEMVDKLVELTKESPDDEHGCKKDIVRWLTRIQTLANDIIERETE